MYIFKPVSHRLEVVFDSGRCRHEHLLNILYTLTVFISILLVSPVLSLLSGAKCWSEHTQNLGLHGEARAVTAELPFKIVPGS